MSAKRVEPPRNDFSRAVCVGTDADELANRATCERRLLSLLDPRLNQSWLGFAGIYVARVADGRSGGSFAVTPPTARKETWHEPLQRRIEDNSAGCVVCRNHCTSAFRR